MRTSAIVFLLALVTGAVHGQSTKGRPSASKGSATESAPKFKAIWEPVNYGKDINLQALHFVSAEEGWVVGDKNTILHTASGGKTWEVQLGGDLESTERALSEVFFVDAKHGWARAAEKLFRTRDGGGTWEQVASKSGHWRKLTFVSPRIGFIIHADAIERTEDGGQTWKPIFKCTIDLLVGGLARKSACTFRDLAFPSTQFGYAIGTDNAGAGAGILARTQDGGQTWVATHPASLDGEGLKLRFWDDKSGIAMVRGKNLVTRDSGETWTPTVLSFHHGDTSLALAGQGFGVAALYQEIAYTTNAGRSFATRAFPIPTSALALHFPDAQHGYVIGDHGMVYRYRIVPIAYQVPGLIPAVSAP